MSNSIGKTFIVTSFGESHGKCVGTVVDGCPAGLPLTAAEVQKAVNLRKPETSAGGTARREADKVEIASGVFKGLTTGAPLCLLVWNADTDSSIYERMKRTPRPGHADYTAFVKYGGHADYRGGGRFSGRITLGFVMAGAVATKLLRHIGIDVLASTVRIGDIEAAADAPSIQRKAVYASPVRCADAAAGAKMIKLIDRVRKQGDSVGGVVQVLGLNLPAGLGEPIFDTLEGDLSKAFFAVPAVKGVEFGSGFKAALMRGSDHNDQFAIKRGKVAMLTNNGGGVSGGISNGMPLIARLAFKPTPSIALPQQSIDLETQKSSALSITGRHDTCIVPRAVPVVEAMTSIVLCDFARRAGLIGEVITWP